MVGVVWGSAFLGFLHRLHSDPLVVPKSVSRGISTSVYGEVYTALLLSDGDSFDLLRSIVVYLWAVYAEYVVYSLFERRRELFDTESVLLCCVRAKPCVHGKSFAIEKKYPARRWIGTEIRKVIDTRFIRKNYSGH